MKPLKMNKEQSYKKPAVVPPLLTANDPHPFEIVNETGGAPFLLVSDHAGTAVPAQLARLGLSERAFAHHWAQDVGIRHLTVHLARLLDAPAILGNYSRIVVDLNRTLDHPTAFPPRGEDMIIPGNADLTDEDKKMRAEEIYRPYHRAVDALVGKFTGAGRIPAVISLHSFTQQFFNLKRPWDIGMLWVQDRRIPQHMIDFFKGHGFITGDNEPYDARALRGTTLNRVADEPGYPNVLIEYRNDHIDTPAKSERWAALTAECLKQIAADEKIFSLYQGPRAPYDPAREKTYFDELISRAKRGE